MPEPIRVLVGIPSGGSWLSAFGMDLTALMIYATGGKAFVEGVPQEVTILNQRGTILPELRQNLANAAVNKGYTHLLFIDADQTFPKDTLHRLLAHNVDIVSVNVATKQFPSSPTARFKNPINPSSGAPLFTLPNSTGLQEVWRVGTGIMLIKTSVFKALPPPPWFPIKWNGDAKKFIGEDWSFCEIVTRKGFKIYVDQDLSKEIGHVGNFTYTYEHVAVPEQLVVSGAYEALKNGESLDAVEERYFAPRDKREYPGTSLEGLSRKAIGSNSDGQSWKESIETQERG